MSPRIHVNPKSFADAATTPDGELVKKGQFVTVTESVWDSMKDVQYGSVPLWVASAKKKVAKKTTS